MAVEITITSDADRAVLEAALWHREYRHICANDRRIADEESAFSQAVGDAWTEHPLHEQSIEDSAPEVWRTLRRLIRLRTRILEARTTPVGTVLRWDVDAGAFCESLVASRGCVEDTDGVLVEGVDPERALAFLYASVDLEQRLAMTRVA